MNKDIEPFASALDKVFGATGGATFNWKVEEYPDRGFAETRVLYVQSKPCGGITFARLLLIKPDCS